MLTALWPLVPAMASLAREALIECGKASAVCCVKAVVRPITETSKPLLFNDLRTSSTALRTRLATVERGTPIAEAMSSYVWPSKKVAHERISESAR